MQIIISSQSSVPLYEQITQQIKSQILSGSLLPDEALPSIRLLAKELRVSIITTKRAYEDLEAEGFIRTVAGKGTFVSLSNMERLRDAALSQIEDRLDDIIRNAKSIHLSCEELCAIIETMYREESK